MTTETTDRGAGPELKLRQLGSPWSFAAFKRKQQGPAGTFTRTSFVLSKRITDRETGNVRYVDAPILASEISGLRTLLREAESYLLQTETSGNHRVPETDAEMDTSTVSTDENGSF